MNKNASEKFTFYLSLVLYISSFLMPAVGEYKGIALFSMGIVLLTFYGGISGFFVGLFWLSNIFYFAGIITYRKNKVASVTWLATAFITGFLFLLLSLFNLLLTYSDLLPTINTFKIGFWCWLLSFIVIPVSVVYKNIFQ